jgi:hypothetical protein
VSDPALTDDVVADDDHDAAVDRWVQAALEGAPPLTAEQVDYLRGLLPRPDGGDDAS